MDEDVVGNGWMREQELCHYATLQKSLCGRSAWKDFILCSCALAALILSSFVFSFVCPDFHLWAILCMLACILCLSRFVWASENKHVLCFANCGTTDPISPNFTQKLLWFWLQLIAQQECYQWGDRARQFLQGSCVFPNSPTVFSHWQHSLLSGRAPNTRASPQWQ